MVKDLEKKWWINTKCPCYHLGYYLARFSCHNTVDAH